MDAPQGPAGLLWLPPVKASANTDNRQKTADRAPWFDDLERAQGDHWRVQRDVDPATIHARYAKWRVRRWCAIAVIALLSGVAWAAITVAVIAVWSRI